jgi:cytochrome c556
MRNAIIVLSLWTVVNVALTVRAVSRDESRPTAISSSGTSADGRTAVPLPIEARDAVLAEMRLMLGSVHGVLIGAAQSDTAAIREAAAASGLVMAADPTLEKILPEGFLHYGMATHRAFDSLAANASAGPAAAIQRLAAITGTCVTCHAAYRLELK